MIKKLTAFITLCSLVLCFSACSGEKDTLYTTTQPSTLPPQSAPAAPITQEAALPTQVATMPSAPDTSAAFISETISNVITTVPLATVPTPSNIPEAQQTTTPQTTKTYEKTGEMEFSDSADNRYIASVSQKYGVPTDRLVALYTVPENDSNIVLEFDGTTNEYGSLVRNKSTLVAIYSIDKSLNSKRASEDKKLNEYSYGEMKVMFFATTTHIMPEFEELR